MSEKHIRHCVEPEFALREKFIQTLNFVLIQFRVIYMRRTPLRFNPNPNPNIFFFFLNTQYSLPLIINPINFSPLFSDFLFHAIDKILWYVLVTWFFECNSVQEFSKTLLPRVFSRLDLQEICSKQLNPHLAKTGSVTRPNLDSFTSGL